MSNKYIIAQFPMKKRFLYDFVRELKCPNDCVINAIELLGLVNHTSADILRYFKGNDGIQANEIVNIFSIILPNRNFKFEKYTNLYNFTEMIKALPDGYAFFCGITWNDDTKHVFVVARTKNGKAVVIDPQSFTAAPYMVDCNPIDTCIETLGTGKEWYILKQTLYNIDDMEE